MFQIKSTYKSKDTEEFLDKIFYRPFGYAIAVMAKGVNLTPNAVTVLSMIIGAFAGYLFYFNDVKLNMYGAMLLVLSDALDSADGQLARMTGIKSPVGRILDGFATNIIFVSIYVFVTLRLINIGYSYWFFLITLFSGLSHSVQSAIADYYRNAYLYFVEGEKKSEFDKLSTAKSKFDGFAWKKNPVKKLLMALYVNYTNEQEMFGRTFLRLFNKSKEKFGDNIPQKFREEYRRQNKPMLKYGNILTTNTRMIVLIISVLINIPILYFIAEGLLLNILMIYTVVRQNRINNNLILKVI